MKDAPISVSFTLPRWVWVGLTLEYARLDVNSMTPDRPLEDLIAAFVDTQSSQWTNEVKMMIDVDDEV